MAINKALVGKKIPIYGEGKNIRDWIHVEDHINGILEVATKGTIGNTYCIGGNCEKSNLDLIKIICNILDEKFPNKKPHSELIEFVKDRPGHDLRYAINTNLVNKELGWSPCIDINNGLRKTIDWYIDNKAWTLRMEEKSGYKGERIVINSG